MASVAVSAADDAREVFLGPTSGETEEFYTYQRDHPGKEKAEYLAWFEDKFGKEIELRRRRSDQPSDLEYMVIKKRSKYRERIGVESEKLCAYSEANPHKTYRELAAWFQDQFGKEIDITAISRALKRSRASEASVDSPPSQDPPPPVKRGRRSYIMKEAQAQAQAAANGQPPAGSMPTFTVDIAAKPVIDEWVPRSDYEKAPHPRPHPDPLPLLEIKPYPPTADDVHKISPVEAKYTGPPIFPAQPRTAIYSNSPPNDSVPHTPRTPMWATVNPLPANFTGSNGKQDRLDDRRQDRHSSMPYTRPHSRLQSRTRSRKEPASASTSPRLAQTNGASHGGHRAILSRPPSRSSESIRASEDEALIESLKSQLADALNKKKRAKEEVKYIESEINHTERTAIVRSQEQRSLKLLGEVQSGHAIERERLAAELQSVVAELESLRSWSAELERGNTEMQGWKIQFEEAERARVEQARAADHHIRCLEAKLFAVTHGSDSPGRATRSTTPVSLPGGAGYTLRESEDLDVWLKRKFQHDSTNEDKLMLLAEAVRAAGCRDSSDKVESLVGFVDEMRAERRRQQSEWGSMILAKQSREGGEQNGKPLHVNGVTKREPVTNNNSVHAHAEEHQTRNDTIMHD